ncbi:MAG: portal protein [Paraclostridium sp.]
MLIDKKRLDYYLATAKERKDEIRPMYSEVLDYTDPFSSIKDEGKKTVSEARKIDSSVIDSINTLVSFIMSSILSRSGGQWADLEIDIDKLIEQTGGSVTIGDQSITITEDDTSVLDEYINDDSKKVFKYIQGSNYYVEISKAVESFVRLGTGAFAIRETGSTTKPFVYSYVGLDNLFILEDSLSRPNIIFKLHPEVNAEYIMDVFGVNSKLPSGMNEDDLAKVMDVYEIVVPSYDEKTTLTTYNYMVMTSDLSHTIVESELAYNPFVVFRWSIIEGSPWGRSPVTDNIEMVKELEEYKTIFKTQARKIANPATTFYGNEELYYALSMEEGAMNYGGNPVQDGNRMDMQILSSGSNLMPLDKVITETRNAFRQALMVDNLVSSGMEGGKGITASYVNYMAEMFRKRFSNTYELVNSELLEPTFMSPLNIMLKYNMLNITSNMIPYTMMKYVNALSKAMNNEEVNKLLAYSNTIAQLNQANAQMGVYMNMPKTTSYVADMLEIDKDLIPTEEELQQIQEAQRQQAMAIQQQQMGGMNGQEV